MTPFSMMITVGFFVLLTGFFSGSETALMSLNRIKLRHLSESGDRNAKAIQTLLENPDQLFIAILIGTNLSIILASSVFSAYLVGRGNSLVEVYTTLIITPLLLIFGEIIPKTLFRHNAFFLVTALTPLLKIFFYLFYPFSRAFQFLNDRLLRLLGQKDFETQPLVATKSELKYLIQESEKQGMLKTHERSMIYRIFDLGEKNVKRIMTPLHRIMALPASATVGEMLGQLRKSRFSWVPVYGKNLHQFVGFVSLFDVAYEEDVDKPLSTFIRPLVSVREEKAIDEVLVALQRKKSSMALVENADKTTVGLVTIEDLLREIAGGV